MSAVFGVSCVLSVVAVAGTVAVGTELLLDDQRAEAVADIVAISAATAHGYGNGEPCEVAQAFAEHNGAELESCSVSGEDVNVAVSIGARGAKATAGPV